MSSLFVDNLLSTLNGPGTLSAGGAWRQRKLPAFAFVKPRTYLARRWSGGKKTRLCTEGLMRMESRVKTPIKY